MNILISCYSFYPSVGGLEEVNALLARAFVARGHAVKVMTMTRSTEPDNDTFDIMREPGTSDLVRAIRWCDVFLQANVSFRLGWPNFFLRRPWVISLHGNLDAEEGRDGIFSWKSRLKRLSLFVADRVISVSRAVAIRTFPQALVIGNPYRTDVFQHRPDAARPYDLVFLGRLVSDKGVHILIDALALLGERDLRPSLLIIGGGPEESALRERCRTYNLTTQVTFAGVRRGEELVEHLNKCRIMVIPSVWEDPSPIVTLEGIACGCVVVAANAGGLPDAVGPCGLIFAKGDAGDLANVLSGLLANEERIRALRLGAADYLFAHRPEAVADNYLRALAGVS
jgi:glycogen synthase